MIRVVFDKAYCYIDNNPVILEVGKRYKVEIEFIILKNAKLEEMDNYNLLFSIQKHINGYFEIDYDDIIKISEVD